MPGDDLWSERSGDELKDDEYPEPDESDNETSDTVPCPACGVEIYEDSDRCPACGKYVSADINPWQRRPIWWILLGLAGIGALIYALTVNRL